MRSARAHVRNGGVPGPLAAQLLVELAVQCQGNKKFVNVKSARVTMSGDSEELQVYSLTRHRQMFHAFNPALYNPYTYPNFLGVDVKGFSQYALMTCFSVPLSPEDCVANAETQRDKLAVEVRARIEELRTAASSEELTAEDRADLAKQIEALEQSINNQLKSYEHFDPDNVKLAFRLVRYYIDVHGLMKIVNLKKEWIREQIDKRIIETMGAPLDEDDRAESAKRQTEIAFCARWTIPTLIELGLARAEHELMQPTYNEKPAAAPTSKPFWHKVTDSFKQLITRKKQTALVADPTLAPQPQQANAAKEEIYVRYDFQGMAKTARERVPQFNIYKAWQSIRNYQLMKMDAQGYVSEERAMRLRDAWLKQVNLLIATVSFGVWRLDPPTWRAMMRRPAANVVDEEQFLKKTLAVECTAQLPDVNWQRPAASLIRQDRASEDAATDLKQHVDPELEKARKRKAEQEGDDPNTKPAEDE